MLNHENGSTPSDAPGSASAPLPETSGAKRAAYDTVEYKVKLPEAKDVDASPYATCTTFKPTAHSALYQKYATAPSGQDQKRPAIDLCKDLKLAELAQHLTEETDKVSLSQLNYLLHEHIDAQFGILSVVDEAPQQPQFLSGVVWRRNAEHAPELKDQVVPDQSLTIDADNMLLRTLSITRMIDQVLVHQTQGSAEQQKFKKPREQLLKLFQAHMREVIACQNQNELAALEEKFDAQLITLLAECQLTKGIHGPADASALLDHYRHSASLLDPAISIETFTRDNAHNVSRIKTSYAITRKTDEQKDALTALQQDPEIDYEKDGVPGDEAIFHTPNYHNAQKPAFQKVNCAIAEKAKTDDSAFSGHGRLSLGPTIKAGFIEKEVLIFHEQQDQVEVFRGIRSATPIYVGAGTDDATRTEYAKQNLAQIAFNLAQLAIVDPAFAGIHEVNYVTLVTNWPKDNEGMMVQFAKEACEGFTGATKFHFSKVSLNKFGQWFQKIQLPKGESSKHLRARSDTGTAWLNGATRQRQATQVLVGSAGPSTITWSGCAKGADRTNAAWLNASQLQVKRAYKKHGYTINEDEGGRQLLGNICAKGLEWYWITAVRNPGSPGMLKVSKPSEDLVHPDVTRVIVTQTAEKYKGAPVPKTPWYKNWRFWAGALFVGIGVTLLVTGICHFAGVEFAKAGFTWITASAAAEVVGGVLTTATSLALAGVGSYLVHKEWHKPKVNNWKFVLGVVLLGVSIAGFVTGIGALAGAAAFVSAVSLITGGLVATDIAAAWSLVAGGSVVAATAVVSFKSSTATMLCGLQSDKDDDGSEPPSPANNSQAEQGSDSFFKGFDNTLLGNNRSADGTNKETILDSQPVPTSQFMQDSLTNNNS